MEAINIQNQLSTETLLREKFTHAMTYKEFRAMVDDYAAEGKTSGPEQKDAYINYTLLNSRRMKRWDKLLKLDDIVVKQLKAVNTGISWLVLSETWCGDAAPTMPLMNKIAEANPNIEFRVLLRDENLDLMERFLTNGTMSIPKLISFNSDTGQVIGDWGPLPTLAAEKATAYKRENGGLTPEFKEDLQRWFNKDKGKDTLADLLKLLPLE